MVKKEDKMFDWFLPIDQIKGEINLQQVITTQVFRIQRTRR